MKPVKFILISVMALHFFNAGAQLKATENSNIQLPAGYFELLESGIATVKKKWTADPSATLASLESQPGWTHFPNAILIPAVLYSKPIPSNKHFGDKHMLELAKKDWRFFGERAGTGKLLKKR